MSRRFNPHRGLARWTLYAITGLVLAYLVVPLVIIIPISFTSVSLLIFPPPSLSLRWYEELVTNPVWATAVRNSLLVGVGATVCATVLGTLCAVGLNMKQVRFSRLVTAIVLSPMIVPIVITAIGTYFFYSAVGLVSTFLGLIVAHTTIAIPFVVITVSASLERYEPILTRAALICGASPVRTFMRVMLPIIAPGILSGALFAFATSFDEVVIALFLAGPNQRTLPLQIFSGIRETINPTIASAATLLTIFAVGLMLFMAYLRQRSERMRSTAPAEA
ncbi:MAG: ABC transporter permease [Dongiaceae bacterium]